MLSLILSIIFLILFIFLCIIGFNSVLRSMIDNSLGSENFSNINNSIINTNIEDNSIINPIDECKKIDIESQESLNFQTTTNIPLSPNYYKNYIGKIYIDEPSNNNELKYGLQCLKKNKLLYDGIWDPIINKDASYEYETWNLTNGNIYDDYYCSNKLLEINKPFPENYIDKSATPPIEKGYYYTYFNDTQNDVCDKEISCFPQIFNTGFGKIL